MKQVSLILLIFGSLDKIIISNYLKIHANIFNMFYDDFASLQVLFLFSASIATHRAA